MSGDRGRRAFLGVTAAAATTLLLPHAARGLGRTPVGGRIAFHLPWPTATLDPHASGDALAAILGPAIADPLFALDGAGAPYPALAATLPVREDGATVVRLREGLLTARGAPLDARDVVASVERSRQRGGTALLATLPRPTVHRRDPLVAIFGQVDPDRLAVALAAPLVALLPRRFDPAAPDGTGAFRADLSPTRLVLVRNDRAARGPAFLDSIDVVRAPDLRASLRAFESERDDLGWLGAGLHGERRGSRRFDRGVVAYIVLRTGPLAGAFGHPGVAQRLVDALPASRLGHLGLGPLPPGRGDGGWGGPAAELLVDAEAGHLVEVARTIAPLLSRPDHEVTPLPVSAADLARRTASGGFALSIEVARLAGPSPLAVLLGLATADDPGRARALAAHPPRLDPRASARSLTSTLRLGVLGELRVSGAAVPELVIAAASGGPGWDLGSTHRIS